jgi:hypothetical protein
MATRQVVRNNENRLLVCTSKWPRIFHEECSYFSLIPANNLILLISDNLIGKNEVHYRVHKSPNNCPYPELDASNSRPCVTFRNKPVSLQRGVFSSWPNSYLQNHPMLADRCHLLIIFATTVQIWKPSPPSTKICSSHTYKIMDHCCRRAHRLTQVAVTAFLNIYVCNLRFSAPTIC